METQIQQVIADELKRFHCSILLEEIKEKVRKLKAYGVEDARIDAIIYDDEIFPQLIVTNDFRICLSETSNEVKMEPIVKAIYLLFLSHPEGIIIKDMPDYRKELTMLYERLRPAGLTDRVLHSIEDVTNPTLNSINEKCARIRKIFEEVLPRGVARYYYISGKRGERKLITLPRVNITLQCELPASQGL